MPMSPAKSDYATIDEYIALFPADIQKILNEIRAIVRAAAPDAEEKISYQIPTFTLKGNLVHFAAYKDFISFYPTSSGINAFHAEASAYETGKGTLRFPLDQPMPTDLIRRITLFRVQENLARAEAKKRK